MNRSLVLLLKLPTKDCPKERSVARRFFLIRKVNNKVGISYPFSALNFSSDVKML